MLRNLSALVILFLVLTACGGNDAPTPSPGDFAPPTATLERAPIRTTLLDGTAAPPPTLAGKFIFAPGDGSIWVQDPVNKQPNPVIKPTPEMFADAPNWSPDGKSFLYVQSTLTEQGTARNSIYRANADGSDIEIVADPPNNKTAFNWPQYSADGKWIYYTSSYPVPPNKLHSEIQRIAVGGGEPQTIVEDARMSTESPDGTKIAFIRFNFDTFTAGLWIADIDGKDPQLLISDDVFIMIAAPQFSPDGSEILFAASGPNTRPLPGIDSLLTPRCEPVLLCIFAKPAYGDGLPWDLWTVTADGKKFSRLTEVGADSPWPAWLKDGKHVAFYDTSGQYVLDVSNKVVAQLNRNGGHGVFAWWQ